MNCRCFVVFIPYLLLFLVLLLLFIGSPPLFASHIRLLYWLNCMGTSAFSFIFCLFSLKPIRIVALSNNEFYIELHRPSIGVILSELGWKIRLLQMIKIFDGKSFHFYGILIGQIFKLYVVFVYVYKVWFMFPLF